MCNVVVRLGLRSADVGSIVTAFLGGSASCADSCHKKVFHGEDDDASFEFCVDRVGAIRGTSERLFLQQRPILVDAKCDEAYR